MTDYLTLIGEFFEFIFHIGLWMIFWTLVFKIYRAFTDTKPSEEEEELVNKVMTMIHQIKQEKHGDIYYWFDKDTDAFLGQGKNDNEIKEHLKERFKGHIFLLDDKSAWVGPELQVIPISELTKNPAMVPKL